MPKTASKRADARRETRIQRAHQATMERAVPRRVPAATRRPRPRGLGATIRNYPWASAIFVVLVVGLVVLVMRQQQLGPFAPPAKPKPTQAHCNITTHICDKAPLFTIDKNRQYTATIHTSKGDIVIELNRNSPTTVNNFVFLANQGFYNGLTFWRVDHKGEVSDVLKTTSPFSLIQGGAGGHVVGNDPSHHNGDAGYALLSEIVPGSNTAGTVVMVNSSQFFINTEDNSKDIPSTTYNIFGAVKSGLDVARQIVPDDKILSISITSVLIAPQQTTHVLVNIATGVIVDGKPATVLTDAKGKTLYYFKADTATKSACTGTCTEQWLALHGSDFTGVVSQLSGKLSTLQTADGSQVMYNGHPLYTFAGDKNPGDVGGQGSGGQWFVATPDLPVQK